RAGPLTTVQDEGRPGYAHLGVSRSGALDLAAMARANRLVGNAATAAVLETTFGGVSLRALAPCTVGVRGAAADVTVDGRPVASNAAIRLRRSQVLDV